MKLLHIDYFKRLAALLGVLVVLAAPVVPTAVLAQEGGDPAPKCAVSNFGPIPCPVNVGQGTDKCFVRDPAQTDAAAASSWKESACDDPAFTGPATIDCSKDVQYCDPATRCGQTDSAGNAINCDLGIKYINPLIKAVAAMVGLAVTASIIWAGIQYATSADDPQKVTAAKQRMLTSVLTLLGFFLFFAFLNWIIPGGVV